MLTKAGDILFYGTFLVGRFAYRQARSLKRNVQDRCWLLTHPSPFEPVAQPIQHAEVPIDDDAVPQQSSRLMQLPYDIRVIIWELVLATEQVDAVLHLDLNQGSVQAKSCINDGWLKKVDVTAVCCAQHLEHYQRSHLSKYHPDKSSPSAPHYTARLGYEHQCWDLPWPREEDARDRWGFMSSNRRKVLPFLQTCKQIHNEAFPFAYAGSLFDVRRVACLARLPQVLPAHVLQNVKHVRFSTAFKWPVVEDGIATPKLKLVGRGHSKPGKTYSRDYWLPPDDASDWLPACKAISSMQLQSLSMHLRICLLRPRWQYDPIDMDEAMLYLLEPLANIKVADFKVTINMRLSVWLKTHLEASKLPYTLSTESFPTDYTWEEANEKTDDSMARSNDGDLGPHMWLPTNPLYVPKRRFFMSREERMIERAYSTS